MSALTSALSHFKQRNNELLINGNPVSEIVAEYGTPLYVYDSSIIKWRCETLRRTIPDKVNIYYAVKANPNLEIIKIMGECYDGFDVASKGELEILLNKGVSPSVISFTGPGKSIDELELAVSSGIGSISIESESELVHIQRICRRLNKEIDVLLRINPSFELSGSGVKMGGGPKQFGIDSEKIPGVIEQVKDEKLVRLKGIHIFSGSQNLNAEQLCLTYEEIMKYSCGLSVLSFEPSIINLGGGFGIPYYDTDNDLDLELIGGKLKHLLEEYKFKIQNSKLIIELGRYLVGESGLYLTRVLYRKISRGKVFIITDGGMHQNLAASGNLGQSLVKRPMPLAAVTRLTNITERAAVTGRLCTPIDTFGTVDIPVTGEGDLIAVLNSGAYGYSASPLGFLSHEPPKEVVI